VVRRLPGWIEDEIRIEIPRHQPGLPEQVVHAPPAVRVDVAQFHNRVKGQFFHQFGLKPVEGLQILFRINPGKLPGDALDDDLEDRVGRVRADRLS